MEDAEMRRAEHRVVQPLPGEVDLLCALKLRALREVVWLAVVVLRRYRPEDTVLHGEVDEALVRVADDERARRALKLAAAVQPAEERRVRRAVLLAHGARRREASENGQ